MTRSNRCTVAAAGLLAAALVGNQPAAFQPSPMPYSLTLLPTLGGSNSRGNSINNAGWIAGYSDLADQPYRHAALWDGDRVLDLGTLGGVNKPKNSNIVWPVKNTRGILVGISQTDAPDPWGESWSCAAFFPPSTSTGFKCVGFVWENGVMRRLPTLGGTHGFAAAANNHGQIAGWAENRVRDRSCTPPQVFQFRAVVWGPAGKQIHELPLLRGDTSSAATAINDQGQIVGISGTCDNAIGSATAAHAVLWENGTVVEIPNFGGAEWNTPTAINEQGDVVGFSDHTGDVVTEAFIWSKARDLQGLGFLEGHGFSEAFGLNGRRQAVGLSCTAAVTDCRAFLWEGGPLRDLNELVAREPGIVLTHAMDINDDGVITGRAFNSNTNELVAYVATPVAGIMSARGFAFSLGIAETKPPQVDLPVHLSREILWPLGPGPDELKSRLR
jgi:probable HAF family extracellular repeat protein